MAQKDKVKELVGRGLNSYHTKALQQMNRIEKKNKEQNHKISILSNELDNDYLTKTEEGSVVSLEHSKEGMVYLDELQGNTLVNYCTDGSKEMTLNGDIDVEGTYVTTTEGVDNGKVDVMREGNTLVNLVKSYGYHANKYSHVCFFRSGMLKPNTKYSAIITNPSNEDMGLYWNEGIFNYVEITIPANSTKVFTHTTKAEMNIDEQSTLFKNLKTHTQAIQFKAILLEGDWTNREVPPYFEGMKSVGQDNENGHKIEILSRNKNLFDINSWKDATVSSGQRFDINNNTVTILGYNSDTYTKTGATGSSVCSEGERKYLIEVKPNTTYTLSMEVEGETSRVNYVQQYNENYANLGLVNYGSSTNDKVTFTTKPNCKYVGFRIGVRETGATLVYSNILLEEGSQKTNYVNYNTNKKEISLNKPLRKANDFHRDRLVKIGSKWFIERNTKEVVLDGTQNVIRSNTSVKDETLCRFDFTINGLMKGSSKDKQFICDTLPYLFIHGLAGGSTNVAQECITNHSADENFLNMVIKKSRLETIDIVGVNKWLSNNNIKIIIPMATPIYEPLEVEPTLNTYNDITHISNNSIIPCNMKIQNTGYNAIIKPSTLYTVALDTNKSGTIGMNLGGAKVTTTNNVALITTPATLTDDSLRLYGKGIKGSKVRLLEGDKTNWIPSYFDGMKSSFEDKVQSDGTYKMEILSNNKNLFDYKKPYSVSNANFELKENGFRLYSKNSGTYHNACFWVKVKPNTKYRMYCGTKVTSGSFLADAYTKDNIWHSNIMTEFNTKNNTLLSIRFYCTGKDADVGDVEIINPRLIESGKDTNYIENEVNKIQFSSIEPLRGVGDVHDRLVFKDGKLMIERNCKQVAIQNSDIDKFVFASDLHSDTYLVFRLDILLGRTENDRFSIKSNKFATRWFLGNNKAICEGVFGEQLIGYAKRLYISIDKKRLTSLDTQAVMEWLVNNEVCITYTLAEPTYEEIPYELQKIILEGYENGTLFFDTNIPPTSTVTYAGETPIVKSVRLNKTEVLNNTNDINDNIIPYLMDMDYRVVCLQLQSENINDGVSMARLFGGTYEMLQRDIQSKRYSMDEYKHRLDAYLDANKITEEEYNKLGDMLNE